MPAFLEQNLSGIGIFHCISPSSALRHQGQSIIASLGLVRLCTTTNNVYVISETYSLYKQKAARKKVLDSSGNFARIAISGPKKVSISRATPSNAPC
jgi:hypothetical protein